MAEKNPPKKNQTNNSTHTHHSILKTEQHEPSKTRVYRRTVCILLPLFEPEIHQSLACPCDFLKIKKI